MSEEKKKISKAQQRAVNEYMRRNYDRIGTTFPKGSKAVLREAADLHDESVNAFIIRAVTDALQRDGLILPGANAEDVGTVDANAPDDDSIS